jgi:hypothetical protein
MRQSIKAIQPKKKFHFQVIDAVFFCFIFMVNNFVNRILFSFFSLYKLARLINPSVIEAYYYYCRNLVLKATKIILNSLKALCRKLNASINV